MNTVSLTLYRASRIALDLEAHRLGGKRVSYSHGQAEYDIPTEHVNEFCTFARNEDARHVEVFN